jgi:hypothetical protein
MHAFSPSLRSFSGAVSLSLDALANMLYVADAGNDAIRVITLSDASVVTLAGGGAAAVWAGAAAADGAGVNATLAAPSGVAWLAAEGLLLIAEAGAHRLRTLNVTVRHPRARRGIRHPCAFLRVSALTHTHAHAERARGHGGGRRRRRGGAD